MYLPSSKMREILAQTLVNLESRTDLPDDDLQWLRRLTVRLMADLDTSKAVQSAAPVRNDRGGDLVLSTEKDSGMQ